VYGHIDGAHIRLHGANMWIDVGAKHRSKLAGVWLCSGGSCGC
jgi:hypothetical protein